VGWGSCELRGSPPTIRRTSHDPHPASPARRTGRGRSTLQRMTTKPLVFALALGCAGKQAPPATTEAPPQIGQPAAAPRFVAVTDLKKSGAEKSPGLAALELELQRAMKELKEQDPPPYFIAYEVHDRSTTSIDARNGALVGSNSNRFRVMDVDVRVGSHKFDSGHPLTARAFDHSFGSTAVPLPIDDDAAALRG